jgi:hypothetical protein
VSDQQMLFDGMGSQASPVKRPRPWDHGKKNRNENFEAIQSTLSDAQNSVLRVIRGRQWIGATREEISEAAGIKLATVCGRCNELKKMGLAVETDKRRRTSSGKSAVVLYHWEYVTQ